MTRTAKAILSSKSIAAVLKYLVSNYTTDLVVKTAW